MFNRFVSLCFTLLIALTVLVSGAKSATAADLVFYEGNGCSQDIVFSYNSSEIASENCKESGYHCSGDNDEARSLKIYPGTLKYTSILVFDDPSGGTDDDYAQILYEGGNLPTQGACVETFERTADYEGVVHVDYHRDNGLDGKVSHVTVFPGFPG